jgi:hypothetical protein
LTAALVLALATGVVLAVNTRCVPVIAEAPARTSSRAATPATMFFTLEASLHNLQAAKPKSRTRPGRMGRTGES